MAQHNLPDKVSTPNGKRLYGAYLYGRLDGRPHLAHVSHNAKALRRNYPNAIIFPVRCTEKTDRYGTYERISKEPVAA